MSGLTRRCDVGHLRVCALDEDVREIEAVWVNGSYGVISQTIP
jgi:hypothetical protein